MREALKRIPAQYYPLLMFSGFSMLMLFGRVSYTGSDRFLFMAWNLFLAWLPLVLAWLLAKNLKKSKWLSIKNIIYSFFWLSFLPNSFYLVTDLIHLWSSASNSLLFDSVMLMGFGITGILIGCTSIYIIHSKLQKRLKTRTVWTILFTVFAMSGLAIYLGRDLGWNSWDLFTNPLYIVFDLSSRLASGEQLADIVGVTLLFFVFISVCYTAFYSGLKSVKLLK